MRIEYSKALDGTTIKRLFPESEEDERLIGEMINQGLVGESLSWGDIVESIPEEEFDGAWSEEELAAMEKDSD